jgi:diguanylate cyclase (GGDEF)-like protein
MPPIHLPTLLLAFCALLLMSALALTLFGRARHVYAGYFRWVGAAWLAAIGLSLLMLAQWQPALALAGQFVLLVWPTATLAGFRRFHRRSPPPGGLRGDALVLALGAALAAACTTVDRTLGATGFAFAGALLHGHAAARLWAAPGRPDSPGLRTLVALLAATAFAFAAVALRAFQGSVISPQASALLVVPGALLMVVLALQFTHERAERELRESRRRLRFLANIDMLTKVPNRRRFAELARRALERDKSPAAMLILDIDHFKHINDLLGHSAGDRALRLVARCVQHTLRTPDVAGRHGGDEFVLLLPRTTVLDAMVVASRIVERVQSLAEEQAIPQLSLSFGVVQTQRGETVDEALHRADLALYEAKRQGRSRVVAGSAAAGADAVFAESRRLGLTPS